MNPERLSKNSKSIKSELRSLDKQFALVMDYNKNLVTSNRNIMNQLHEFKKLFEISMKKMVFITYQLGKDSQGELTNKIQAKLEELGIKDSEKDNDDSKGTETAKLIRFINEKLSMGSDLTTKLTDMLLSEVYNHLHSTGQLVEDKNKFLLSFEGTIQQNINDLEDDHNMAYIVTKRQSESIDKDINSSISAFEMTHKKDDNPIDNNSIITDQNLVDFGDMDSINFGDSLLNTPLRPMSEDNFINNDELGVYDWKKNANNNANFL